MPNTIEVVYVDGDSAVCDGGGGVLGHPKVYLAIDHTGRVSCPYCGRLFVRDPSRAGEVESIPQSATAALASSAGSTSHH